MKKVFAHKYIIYFCQMRRIAVCALVCYFCTAMLSLSNIAHAETGRSLAQTIASGEVVLTDDYYALPGFSSHMPIIVIDMQGNRLAEDQYGYFLNASIELFDGKDQNAISAGPSLSQAMKVRNISNRTNEAFGQNKDDYFLRFIEPHSLLGFAPANEYFLFGAMSDKSLIRNYIGYKIALGIMPGLTDIRLCEVFLRTAKGDLYQGVYSLVQKHTAADTVLFHRNIVGDGIVIENYANTKGLEESRISIPFMESLQWNNRLNSPVGDLSDAEAALYSNDPATFYTVLKLFNVDSFINNFIIGELTENYAGMYDTYYSYDIKTQMFMVAPIWNFEHAFDNDPLKPAVIDQIQYDEAPYYRQFFKSPKFAKQLQEKNIAFNRDILNEKNLLRIVNDAAMYVAPAVKRDWQRWDSYRNYPLQPLVQIQMKDEAKTVQQVVPFSRQTETYEEELIRLKYRLREHNLHMAHNITIFDFTEQEVNREIVLTSNQFWPVAFLVVFFFFMQFARRYGI